MKKSASFCKTSNQKHGSSGSKHQVGATPKVRTSKPKSNDSKSPSQQQQNGHPHSKPRSNSHVTKIGSSIGGKSSSSMTKGSNSKGSKNMHTTSSADLKSRDIIPISSDKVIRYFKVNPNGRYKNTDDVIAAFGYKMIRKIDEGGFGSVYIAHDRRKKIDVACKKMKLGSHMDDERMEDSRNELRMLEKVRHPYVIKLECYFIVKQVINQVFMFMELADGGNLFKHIQKAGLPDEHLAKLYFGQILCGLNHMHNLGIAHRDVKPANVLLVSNERSISGDFILKISDFGFSLLVQKDADNHVVLIDEFCGTPVYMAPELRAHQFYNPFLVDVFALGVSLFEVFTLKNPFWPESGSDAEQSKSNGKTNQWRWPEGLREPPSQKMTELMKGMLEADPTNRFNMQKVMQHTWAQNYYETAHSRSDLFKEEREAEFKPRESEFHD